MKCRNHFVKRDSCSTIPPTPHIIRIRMGVVFFCNGGFAIATGVRELD